MPSKLKIIAASAIGAAVILTPISRSFAADAPKAAATPTAASAAQSAQAGIDKALDYLKSQQLPDGGWQKENEPPALTAIALRALTGDEKYAKQENVSKGFAKLLTFQKEDGSISTDMLATYNTAIATSALALSGDPKLKAAADKAVAYLKSIQWTDKIEGVKDQSKKVDPNDPNFGGWGYGRKGRADLSNAQFALQALKDAGLKPGDPAFDAAVKFVERNQNNSETNKDPKGFTVTDDGGFFYTPAQGGMSEAGEVIMSGGQRVMRSYGSMTYAGLKSMIYAGLSKSDPRVQAAWKWIGKNWTLDVNPGFVVTDPKHPEIVESGLYYYYHTLARALRAYGEPIITDSKGVKHDWRLELIAKLTKEQKADGSWAGTQRWMEGRPALSTSFAALALEEARDDLKEHPAQ